MVKRANMSQRRRASQNNGESTAKRARISKSSIEDSGIEIATPDKTVHEGAEVGILESIDMKNFMCHSRLKFSFCQNVNFIVGKNGSGKSAVLMAVMVGLGGNASCTNRGSSIKSFIKNGCSSTDVTVRLRNVGRDAFKPDDYGNSINVERHILASGVSTYRLRGARGNVVSTKKEELTRILDQFNIQVENPICILNQDASRHFLHSENAKNKYKLFLRATQLDQIRRADSKTAESRIQVKSIIEQKRASVPALEQQMADWKAKLDYHNNLSKYEDKIKLLHCESAWVHVAGLQSELEKDQTKLARLNARMVTIDEHLDMAMEELKEKKAAHLVVAQQLADIDKEIDEIRPRCLEAKALVEAEKLELQRVKRAQQQLNADIRNQTRDKDKLSERIKQLQELENSNEKQLRQQELEQLREQRASLETTQKEIELDLEHHKHESDHLNDVLYQDRQEETAIRNRLEGARRNLADLEGSRANNVRRFGPHMPAIIQNIEQAYNRGKFRQKPKGPLGAYIKVKDAKYTLAVEICLKGLLGSFYCDNYEDERVLEAIIRRVVTNQYIRRPNIITGRFEERLYDVRANAASNDSFPTVLEMIDCQDAAVLNCLVDHRGIECILLMESGEASRRVMQREPPRRCKEAYTVTGDQMYPRPNYRFYSATIDKATLLQESVEDAIKTLAEKIGVLESQFRQAQAKVAAGRASHANATQRQKATEQRVMRTQRELRQLAAKINELESIDDPEPVHVIALQEDLQVLTDQLLMSDQNMTDTRSKLQEQQRKWQEATLAYEKVEARRSTILTENVDPLKESLGKAQHAIGKAESKREHSERIRKNHQKDVDIMETSCQTKEADVAKFSKVAAEFGERPAKVRDGAKVQSEIERLELTLKTNAELYGNKDEAQLKYTQASERCTAVQKEINCLCQFLRTIDRMVAQRQKQYTLLRSYISIRIAQYFTTFMSQRKFTGNLIFEHDKETLEIEVQLPEKEDSSKDMKGLSGGERSFSTVSFMLSLWETIESPFHIMDEFDVFMDMVNRRVSMDMLVDIAHNKKLNQFLFLTPLDMTKLQASQHVRIFKMADPDRNQTVLPFTPINANTNDERLEEEG